MSLNLIDDINRIPNKFYLFSYGANNIEQLSKKFGINHQVLENNIEAYSAKGLKQVFFSNLDESSGSVATLKASPNNINNIVKGLLIKITKKHNKYKIGNVHINFINFLKLNAFPNSYVLSEINHRKKIPIFALVRNRNYLHPETVPVSDRYLKEICKTINDHYRLDLSNTRKSIIIDIAYIDHNGQEIQFDADGNLIIYNILIQKEFINN